MQEKGVNVVPIVQAGEALQQFWKMEYQRGRGFREREGNHGRGRSLRAMETQKGG